MADSDPESLQVANARPQDVGKGTARIGRNVIQSLGIPPGKQQYEELRTSLKRQAPMRRRRTGLEIAGT